MTTETFIYVLVTNLITLALSTIYYATRVDELRRDQQRRLSDANAEIMAMRKMRQRTDMQARTYGAVPISRLIGGDDA